MQCDLGIGAFNYSCRRLASNARTAHAPSLRFLPSVSGPHLCVVPQQLLKSGEAARLHTANGAVSSVKAPHLICSQALALPLADERQLGIGAMWRHRLRMIECKRTLTRCADILRI